MRKYLLIISSFMWLPAVMRAQPAKPFANEIAAFRSADSMHMPAPGAILFVGSSSFRLWNTIQQDFPGYRIVNRGFGGSSLPDLINYAEDIIFPYRPRQIVIYCGENDLAASDTVTASMVADRFKLLFSMIRKKLPAVPVVYISIKPSPSRERLINTIRQANTEIRRFLRRQKQSRFVDVFHLMTDKAGRIHTDLFIEDRLHMNQKGYTIWKKAITPYLLKD